MRHHVVIRLIIPVGYRRGWLLVEVSQKTSRARVLSTSSLLLCCGECCQTRCLAPLCGETNDLESNWVFCPDACDIFVGRKAAEVLQPATVIVGVDEDLKVLPELVMAVVVIAFDGGVLDGAVHSLDLSVGPGMVRLGEPVLDAVLAADLVEAVNAPGKQQLGIVPGNFFCRTLTRHIPVSSQ